MNIYSTLGLEKLIEDKALNDTLINHINDNIRYVIPGFLYDHKLHTTKSYLEFYSLVDATGKIAEIDMHFSDNNFVSLNFEQEIDEPGYYRMTSENSDVDFTVKVVNYDVFPPFCKGEKVTGQMVAFADAASLTVKNNQNDGLDIKSTDSTAVEIECIPAFEDYAYLRHFEFSDVSCDFWEMQVKTALGRITVLVDALKCDFNPEELHRFSVKAVLSFDIGVEEYRTDETFYPGISYGDIIEGEEEIIYKNGFVPNLRNNQKVLFSCILKNDYNWLVRACEKRISFTKNNDGFADVDRAEIPRMLSQTVAVGDKIERVHILESAENVHLGFEALAVYKGSLLQSVVSMGVSNKGLIDEIVVFDAESCAIGIDYELNLISVLGCALTNGKANLLIEYLSENCRYRSDYSDRLMYGNKSIIEFLKNVGSNLTEESRYYGEIVPSEYELVKTENMPVIYSSKWCFKQYHYTQDNVSAVVFVSMDDEHKIDNIYLSRDNAYLKHQFTQTEHYAQGYNVKEVLSEVYAGEDTLKVMRNSEIPIIDKYDTYVWKCADSRAVQWFSDHGYKVHETKLYEDCIGYSCARRGKEFAVYVYAYSQERTVEISGDACSKLRDYDLSEGKEILVIYLKVDITANDDGETIYETGNCCDAKKEPEAWHLITVNGRNILDYYPRSEMVEVLPKIISAYNELDYDVMKAIFSPDFRLEYHSSGNIVLNQGVYAHLSLLRTKRGEMKPAYLRKNDVVFSSVGYIEDFGYVGFTMNNHDKVDSIEIYDLGSIYRELFVSDEVIDTQKELYYPKVKAVNFYEPTEDSRFSMRLTFDNNEIRRYDLPIQYDNSDVFEYDGRVVTDKIFRNLRISEHIGNNDSDMFGRFKERGHGIELISGIYISSAELYANSYPVGKFSYENLDGVYVSQLDFDDDGYAVGYIYNFDPRNPMYLLNNNTKTAIELPKEYWDTPICIIPFCGGSCEGLVMVSTTGELPLKYHHNFRSCAGMWGWLDLELNVVIEPQYVYAKHFYNGKAIVCKGDWSVTDTEAGERYWCENEQWGVIDTTGNEIVACQFDELYEVDNSDTLFFVHKGGWDNGCFCIYDSVVQDIVLEFDFDFDIGYMFNECFVLEDRILVMVDHLPGEGKDLICVYDLYEKKYIAYREEFTERTLNGEKKVIVNKDGTDIVVF